MSGTENLQEIDNEEKKEVVKKEKKVENEVKVDAVKYMYKPCGNRKVKLIYDEKLYNKNKINGWTL